MATKKKTAAAKEATRDPQEAVLDAALQLMAEQGWPTASLATIAERAGLSLGELHQHFPTKAAILDAFERRIDSTVLGGGELGGAMAGDERPRDRLFDVLMRRFDALQPHRAAVAALLASYRVHPLGALARAPQLLRSMAWMLEAAGISSAGLPGALRTRGLAAIWLSTLSVWLSDDTTDLAKTMAALDARLRRAEELMQMRLPRRGSAANAAGGAT